MNIRPSATALGQHHRVRLEGVSSGEVAVNQDTDEEAQVGKTCYDECLLGSGDGRRLRVVESNQQIRGDAHQLPEQVHLEDVGSHHQSQHGHGEQRQESVVALEAHFAFHIAEGINMHHERHRADDNKHHYGNRVKQDAHVYAQSFCERQPSEVIRHQCRKRAVCQTGAAEIDGSCRVGKHGYRT